ncbi:amidophosphoribosyltransferase [Clostridium butyricum]|uniref:Amidophosphoribosyltransferase n=1 Tax=Clostridium butyricum TaxID=1492 RepID=A0A6L9ERV1_CLOBU|nr:amidophosphoribosyltransferase [Clostridium butyricum]NAS19410.1 amidophosphoribosyltransferase [Clostridium butyricum]RQN09154.1 amidophosphoribosyltransferase [Clostridium butyricum]
MAINRETLDRIKNSKREDSNMVLDVDETIVQAVNNLNEANITTIDGNETYNASEIIEDQIHDGATQEAILVETEVDDNEENIAEDVLSNAKSVSSRNVSRTIGKAGAISIVNANTGNRITIARECYSAIGNPSKVQFALTDNNLIVGEKVLENNNDFNVKESSGKAIIYSSALVREITDNFNLDFSNRTSLTFSDVQYSNADDVQIMIVKIK